MDVDALRTYCLARHGATEDMPFDDTVLAVRVMGKIFAMISLDDVPARVNLKCDPERCVELRERYGSIVASYHRDKWMMIEVEGDVPAQEIRALIDRSYELVVAGLSKKDRAALNEA
jgi:predicted DNA-binding protein (MmcQ/YjbR family)